MQRSWIPLIHSGRIRVIASGCSFLILSASASADTTTYAEQSKLIKASRAVTTLGLDLFGDRVNLYTGSLEFVQTDVSLPGNSALPVSVGRRLITGQEPGFNRHFGQWDLEIPHLHGVFALNFSWSPRGGKFSPRCSQYSQPPDVTGTSSSGWFASEYWHGNFLYVPGAGDQEMLKRSPNYVETPGNAGGAVYPIVTRNAWQIKCLSSMDARNGEFGEAFLAISPDGTSYRFDWLVERPAPTLNKSSSAPSPEAVREADQVTVSAAAGSDAKGGEISPLSDAGYSLPRKEVWILPTLVTDRYGNTVTYTYDTTNKWQLNTIVGSDAVGSPRTITFTYATPGSTASNLVTAISDGTRTWRYTYDRLDAGGKLQTVVLPDDSVWRLSGLDPLLMGIGYLEGSTGSCDVPGTLYGNVQTGSLTHPSGATGEFVLTPTRHGRVNVDRICREEQNTGMGPVTYQRFFDTYALTRKSITGPGLGSLDWLTAYPEAAYSWAPWDGQNGSKQVKVTDPAGNVTYQHFGTVFRQTEGQLQLTQQFDANLNLLRSTDLAYTEPVTPRGFSLQPRGDGEMAARVSELNQRTITQQSTKFIWKANEFNGFAQPTSVTRSSDTGAFRTEKTVFHNNTGRWVLGQPEVITETLTGKEMVRNIFDLNTANVKEIRNFGAVIEIRTYFADGTIETVSDGLSQATRYASYKRGIPQSVIFADNHQISAVVNNLGGLDSATSSSGATTSFRYDAMGRASEITYPLGDRAAWNKTTMDLVQVAGQEFDLGPAHWKQTITTGQGHEVNYFDALWRPVYTERWDDADRNATQRITKKSYNFSGQPIFESYSGRTYSETGIGIYYEFDALGRSKSTTVDSELGRLTSFYTYSPTSFGKTYTDARGHVTSYDYVAWDQPSEDGLRKITAPEGIITKIGRDIFGKTKSISRGTSTRQVTRSYVHDSAERLCKIIEPEAGSTVIAYDAAHNMTWKAPGLALPLTGNCNTADVTAASKTSFQYDTRNRLKTTTFGDNSPGITRTYTADGLLATISSNSSTWEYEYNKRQMPWHEKLTYGGQTYSIVRTHDANGSLTQLDYPFNAISLTYNPNALGEARKVGGYATGIEYYPNGAVKAFNYGNGIRRTLAQNVRGLPERSTDTGVVDEFYSYDPNGNATLIEDKLQNLATRTMTYDDVDRLKTVSAPSIWGTATYNYDVFDNLVSSTVSGGVNARTLSHSFNTTTNRLGSTTGGPAAFNFSYLYDTRGNITKRGAQSYTFDQANRMTAAVGRASYTYDGLGRRISSVGTDGVNRIQIYTQDGKLFYSGPSGSGGTKYIYLNNHVIAEVN